MTLLDQAYARTICGFGPITVSLSHVDQNLRNCSFLLLLAQKQIPKQRLVYGCSPNNVCVSRPLLNDSIFLSLIGSLHCTKSNFEYFFGVRTICTDFYGTYIRADLFSNAKSTFPRDLTPKSRFRIRPTYHAISQIPADATQNRKKRPTTNNDTT